MISTQTLIVIMEGRNTGSANIHQLIVLEGGFNSLYESERPILATRDCASDAPRSHEISRAEPVALVMLLVVGWSNGDRSSGGVIQDAAEERKVEEGCAAWDRRSPLSPPPRRATLLGTQVLNDTRCNLNKNTQPCQDCRRALDSGVKWVSCYPGCWHDTINAATR